MRERITASGLLKRQRRRRLYSSSAVCALGAVAVVLLLPENVYAFASAEFAIEEICGHMQGKLGGLLMTVAGIGGLTAAAFGNMRATQSLIVVGIGAFAISSVLSIHFPEAAGKCNGGDGGGGAPAARVARSADVNQFNVVEADIAAGRRAALRIGAGNNVDFTIAAPLPALEAETGGEEPFQFDPTAGDVAEDF